MLEILGVDFSGAKTDNRTWVTSGRLDGHVLTLGDCKPVPRAQLAELLLRLPQGSVAALDFPFSVPQPFAHFWQPGASSMPELWAAAQEIDLSQFLALRDDFVARWGEPKRRCDLRFPECYSCLHKANPNMVPMTFYGMRMLGPQWLAGCAVPPLVPPSAGNAVLLEAMPGAALKAFRLPYKGYKKGANALQLRQRILASLEVRSGIEMPNISQFREHCLVSDDALDSLVAAVIASLWAIDPACFWRPSLTPSTEADSVALLEGWLYAPVFLGGLCKVPPDPLKL